MLIRIALGVFDGVFLVLFLILVGILTVEAIKTRTHREQDILAAQAHQDIVNQTIEHLDLTTGIEFENAIIKLLTKEEWKLRKTPSTGDFGADLIGSNPDGETWAIQVKRWGKPVGPKAVQEVVASKAHYQVDNAMVVTNNVYTSGAKKLASSNNVTLWDRPMLIQHLSQQASIEREKQVLAERKLQEKLEMVALEKRKLEKARKETSSSSSLLLRQTLKHLTVRELSIHKKKLRRRGENPTQIIESRSVWVRFVCPACMKEQTINIPSSTSLFNFQCECGKPSRIRPNVKS